MDFHENSKVVSVPATAVIPTVYDSSYIAGQPIAVDVRDVPVFSVAALNLACC